MIRKICKIFSVIAILFATSNAYSQDGFAVGISGSLIDIEASGKHTMRTSGKTDSTGAADNQTGIGSVFAEYTWNNITLGLDYIPGSADISSSVLQRDEIDFQDGATTAGTSISNKAQAYQVAKIMKKVGMFWEIDGGARVKSMNYEDIKF